MDSRSLFSSDIGRVLAAPTYQAVFAALDATFTRAFKARVSVDDLDTTICVYRRSGGELAG